MRHVVRPLSQPGVHAEMSRVPGPPPGVRSGSRRRALWVALLLVVGVPLMLAASTFATLLLLGNQPDYQRPLAVVTTVAVLVPVGWALWLAWTLRAAHRVIAGMSALACVVVGFMAVGVTAGFGSGPGDSPSPTVVNRSSHEVVVFADTGDLRPWVTLGPGESARADRPPFSLDGCYPSLQLVAKTGDGRLLGTLSRVCNNDVWEIKE